MSDIIGGEVTFLDILPLVNLWPEVEQGFLGSAVNKIGKEITLVDMTKLP